MRVTAFLAGILTLSCVVSYDQGGTSQAGRAAAAFGDTESDSRADIDVDIDYKERPAVVPGMTRVGVVFAVGVSNRSQEAIKVTRIQLQTVSDEAAMAALTGRRFKQTIAPGQKANLELGAFFEVDGDSPLPIEGPMVVRATLFVQDPAGNETQEIFTRRIGSVGIGVTSRP